MKNPKCSYSVQPSVAIGYPYPEMKHQIEYVRAVLLRLPRPFYSSPFFSISAIEGADRKSGAALALVVYEALKQIRQISGFIKATNASAFSLSTDLVRLLFHAWVHPLPLTEYR